MKSKIILVIVVIAAIIGAFFAGRYSGRVDSEAAFWARNLPSIYAVLECDADQASGVVTCQGAIQK